MRNKMCSGDVLVVQNMMCLGRNKQEIKQEWETFIEEKIDVVILRSPVIDTRMLYGTNSDEQCVSKAVLSCMMDEEQSRIRSAQREEIENAKKQGKFKGRERKYHPDGIGEEKTVYETIIN